MIVLKGFQNEHSFGLAPKSPMFVSSCPKSPKVRLQSLKFIKKKCFALKCVQTNMCLTFIGGNHKDIRGQADVLGQVISTRIIRKHTPANFHDLVECGNVQQSFCDAFKTYTRLTLHPRAQCSCQAVLKVPMLKSKVPRYSKIFVLK